MKEIKDYLLILCFLIQLFLFWKLLNQKPKIEVNTAPVYIYDTNYYSIPIVIKPPDVSIPITMPADVDTQAILEKFFTKHIYADTLTDSNLTAIIVDTIALNRLSGRFFSYRINRPIEQHIYQAARKERFTVGAVALIDTVTNLALIGGLRFKDFEVIGGKNLNRKQYLIGVKKSL
jgi:hypothetical protein